MTSRVVIALYKPNEGKRQAFKEQIDIHVPTLLKYELVTNRQSLLLESSNGTFLEIFEWVAEDSHTKVHDIPEAAKIWDRMGMLGSFVTLADLEEARHEFPHFTPVED